MKENTQGVLYIATGEKYVAASINSAKSIIHHCKGGMSVSLCCDKENERVAKESGIFDQVICIKNPHVRSKVDYIQFTPYERTLYLDADTIVVADITEMFELLNRFDLAIAHAHLRELKGTTVHWREHIPSSFPQHNGGVLLFRWNNKTEQLFKDWSRYYHEAGFSKDQVTLRELLWKSDLHLYVLPPEYNMRYWWKWAFMDKTEAKPRILHYWTFAKNKFDHPLYFWKLKYNRFKEHLLLSFNIFRQRISAKELKKNKWSFD